MKTKFNMLIISCGIGLGLLAGACEQDLPTALDFTAYPFTSSDPAGGNWQPILLNQPQDIAVPVPEPITGAGYQAELAVLQQTLRNLNANQKAAVRYWTNNPVLRWNEIALELCAKYNLIPAPLADGSYPLPDPNNPDKEPKFPYSHPPYTVRALAYLSVAQYDGLIVAWQNKFKYQRPSPDQVDPTIKSAYGATDLPSYPAAGAVVAVTSRDILTRLFPLEKSYLEAKAKEHLQSLIWSGSQVSSDVAAGELIGASVAKLALQRAAGDGMNKAQTPRAISDSIKTAAFKRFGWQWVNQETPTRPVGLAPFFGRVKMWSVPRVEEVRPGPPPAIGSPEFQRNVEELQQIAEKLTPAQRRIANWWSDGLGTYTPPGHWNRRAKEYCQAYRLNPLRTARTLAYLNMAMMDAGISCWDAKYFYHYPRPIQAIPGFKTILGTPNFPAYTSGHSTFSAAAAAILGYVFPEEREKCLAWAREAAESRIYGGIHYRFDAEVGLEQGQKVAAYTLQRAQRDGAQ